MKSQKPFGRRLLSRARSGDLEAFEVLVDRHRDSLYSFALRLTRSEATAFEIVQQSFLSACRHLNEFPTEAKFHAWIYGVAASQALNRTTPFNRPDSLPDGAVSEQLAVEGVGDSTPRPLSEKLRRAIDESTESLPQPQREVFLLKDVAGLAYEQIASITGDPLSKIKAHLHKARLTIRDRIAYLVIEAVGDGQC